MAKTATEPTTPEMRELRERSRNFARKSIVVDATARLIEQCLLEAHAHLARPTYTDKQKEWLARYLATGLASGPSDRVYKVDIDKWIKDVHDAFDVVDKMDHD